MIDFEKNVIAIGAATATFFYLHIYRPAHHIAAGQILGFGRITFHETFTLIVDQIAAFTTCRFGDQHSLAGNASGMKLEEFHVL